MAQIRKRPGAKLVPIKKLVPNPDNPRKITKASLEKAKKSVTDDDWMLGIRPIIVDEDMVILGGNQRYKALLEMEVTEAWVQVEKGLTPEQKKRFMVKDNISYGVWDFDSPIFLEEEDRDEFADMGLDVPEIFNEETIEERVKFSEFLDEQNNYVVLFFNDRIDWVQAQSHFGLESVSAKRQNGKEWSKGIGRVIDGTKYLKSLKRDDQ